MSDNYISLVPRSVTKSESPVLAAKVVNWLTQLNIIQVTQTDCVLGSDTGYPPGDNFRSIIDGDDYGFAGLWTNGLDVITEKQVFDNGGNGLDSVTCPSCHHDITDTDWGDLITEWQEETGKDKISCSICQSVNSITEYTFEPAWAFGDLGFTFWNWPSLKESFISDLEKVLGKPVTVVYGHL